MACSLSNTYNFLFIPIPRTASVSIGKSLSSFVEYSPLKKIYHPSAKDVENSLTKSGLDWDDYFSFTFVRNPWERAISFFFKFRSSLYDSPRDWIISNQNKEIPKHTQPNKHISSKEFKKNLIPSQSHFIQGVNFDFIGRFENLQHDFNFVCKTIGVPKRSLPRLNALSYGSYKDYYQHDTVEIIRTKYKKEIEMFGYTFHGN